MIECKKCGKASVYIGGRCLACGAELDFDNEDILRFSAALKEARDNNNFEMVLKYLRLLADCGITESEIEYAEILENGKLTAKNLDTAMEYFRRAAEKNHPHAAYRYSRLATRMNDEVARFYLIYSAILGCEEAYPKAAEEFSTLGYEKDAHYFYYLGACCDHVSSIVTMARRYLDGIGTEKSNEYAKWYIDKLKFPPIYALKLAYELRRSTPKEPPTPTPENYDALLFKMARQAKAFGFNSARAHLLKILTERDDHRAEGELGVMLAYGDGCEKNTDEGIRLLSRAAAYGNKDAAFSLGEIYSLGEVAERDLTLAEKYYMRSAECGNPLAYEKIGDIYLEKNNSQGYTRALEFYDAAAKDGCDGARKKADNIRQERQRLYSLAESGDSLSDEERFALYVSSAALGSKDASFRLGECFEHGIGTKKSRKKAFLWYKAAVELGCDEALFAYGRCFSVGIGTNRNFDEARRILTKAERLGDARASELIQELMEAKLKKLLEKLYSKAMRLIYQKNFAAAHPTLQTAAEYGNAKAIYTLGCLYEFGRGVPCDKNRAFALYEEAYAKRYRDPRSTYKLIVLKMVR